MNGEAVQRHRLALLAVLACAYPRAVAREKLMALLWPQRDGERARRLLNQTIHVLRRHLGADVIESVGEELRFGAGGLACDVVAFERASTGGDTREAVAAYAGVLLDGFHLDDSQEFERWLDRERARFASAQGAALESLAHEARRAADHAASSRWWEARAALDPYDSRVASELMEALDRSGRRAAAIRHAATHERLLREDLELDPEESVRALAERLRRGASPDVEFPDVQEASAPVVRSLRETRPVRGRPRALLLTLACAVLLAIAWPRGGTDERVARAGTASIAAHELVRRASDPAVLRSDSGARAAIAGLRRAITLDVAYAEAWVALGRLLFRVASVTELSRAPALRAEGEQALTRAIQLNPSLAEGHAILGLALAMRFEVESGGAHILRAIALAPGQPRIREAATSYYLLADRPREALVEAEQAVAADPLSPASVAEYARALAANGRCDEALARLAPLWALDPPLLRAAPIAAECHLRAGRWKEAGRVVGSQTARGEALATALAGIAAARAGRVEEARDVQARLRARWERGQVGALYLAFVPTGLEERNEAFAWLGRALDDGSLGFAPGGRRGLLPLALDTLRADPRLVTLARRAAQLRDGAAVLGPPSSP